jgi:pyridoxine 5-phosphate synthase
MINLSVNVNKIATLRNSRGGAHPRVTTAVEIAIAAGAPGITVHPRADARHIRPQDVLDVAALVGARAARGGPAVELNIEGDPLQELMDLVVALRPDQCTLVPVRPGEVTSHAGWPIGGDQAGLAPVIGRLTAAGVRVSLFVDPDPDAVRWAADLGAHRVELYTEPYASAFARGGVEAQASFDVYAAAAVLAHDLGLGVNAGHDLDLENLRLFGRLPHLAEVSIGHALVTRALWVGLDRAVREFIEVLTPAV